MDTKGLQPEPNAGLKIVNLFFPPCRASVDSMCVVLLFFEHCGNIQVTSSPASRVRRGLVVCEHYNQLHLCWRVLYAMISIRGRKK